MDERRYDDIIDLPHHRSDKRPHMTMTERAAQFAPFAALVGYEAAVAETARLTDEKTEIDDYDKEVINSRLVMLSCFGDNKPYIEVKYFAPDEKKRGGSFRVKAGVPKKIKEFEQELVMEDGTVIPFSDIFEINGDAFSGSKDI